MNRTAFASPKGVCQNCGAKLAENMRFCSVCGQDHRHRRLRVDELARDLLSDLWTLDGPWFRTLRALVPEAGSLSKQYVNGHRVGHVNPVRFHLIILVVEVALLGLFSGIFEFNLPGYVEWEALLLLVIFVPLISWLLRVTCGPTYSLAEVMVLTLYMLGMTSLTCVLLLGMFGLLAWILHNIQQPWLWNAGVLVIAGIGYVLLPGYLMLSLVRFFGCRWGRAFVVVAGFPLLGLAVGAGFKWINALFGWALAGK
ncbi:zinc-ribbon domain-containing protein [Thermomonas sp.]|uniref:zinc-ribbon domain-containing protein n=1 Tax=Thermomonas sp. TaxID=1971895 RepID=UPI00262114F1|nr:zinc-ribbon domain-containing protein [Thermomonas sp.]MCO5054971.1 zinc-ribbon domain-containing protein [Thermomonas sp.]